jgi:glycosyltransferase involved in cell wall biosynthesis
MTTTRAAAASIAQVVADHGGRALPFSIDPVPVPPPFLRPVDPDPALAGAPPYFVAVGAIEARKNHALLLDAWRLLRARMGAAAPKLVVAGGVAKGAEAIRQSLDGHPDILHAPGLTSPAIRQLVGHAAASLMPSLAEGYGLPVTEALALGTPILASSIPSHLEIGAGFAEFAPPDDPAAWADALGRLASDAGHRAALRARIAEHEPMRAERYAARIDAFLSGL